MELELTSVSGQTIITFPDKVTFKNGKLFVYHHEKVDEYAVKDYADITITDSIWSGR
jgi:hypothetical protein